VIWSGGVSREVQNIKLPGVERRSIKFCPRPVEKKDDLMPQAVAKVMSEMSKKCLMTE
jgi:hypothetical protein